MSNIIFIGGATASGKSTFAKKLNEQLNNSFMYRRFQGFYDIASIKGINDEDIFDLVTSDQVDDYFIEKCCNHDYIISDVHYSVQLFKTKLNNEVGDEYHPTISKSLIDKLINNKVSIICVYIKCSPEICLERANKRFVETKKKIKLNNIDEASIENYHEYYEWNELLKNDNITGIELDSCQYTPDELIEQFLKFIYYKNEDTNKIKVLKKSN